MKYVIVGTPKALSKLQADESLLEKVKEHCGEHEYSFEATTMVYMNLSDPEWTVERCDEVVYIVEDGPPWEMKIK